MIHDFLGADTNNVKDAQTVMDTNVMGVIAFCSAFLPGLLLYAYVMCCWIYT